ncbi:MAG: winged helix DNA-binding domain-containing protein [Dehalococcoidia bacterium]
MAKRQPAGDLVTNRQLNRTLLDRQMLLEKRRMSALEAVEKLVGLQAQEPLPPYIALWNRLDAFDPLELSQHLADRSAVRVTLMRGTVHLVSAEDSLQIRPLVQPVLDRMYRSGVWAKGVNGDHLEAIREVGRRIVEETPLTTKQLGEALQPLWPENDGHSMAYAMHALAPMVHVPPRGLWGGVGQTTVTTLESWLGRDLDPAPAIEDMVRRYLRVFGPASVMDMQSWCGLTRLSEVFERLRPELRSYQDESGRELFDLATSELASPDLPAPVRFNPVYDNLFISHADRSRLGTREFQKMMTAANGFFATFMVDGVFRGRWELKRDRQRSAVLSIMPFATPLSKTDAAAVEEEAQRLLTFLASDAESRDVAMLPPRSS